MTGGRHGAPSAGARRCVARLAVQAAGSRRPISVDSSVLIDFVAGAEPLTSVLRPLLYHPAVPVVVSTVALAELLARPATAGDHARVAAIHATVRSVPGLKIVDLDQQHALETAFARAQTGLKLPDAAIVATARLAAAGALLGNDRQWRHKPLSLAKSDAFPPFLTRVVDAMTA